MPGGIRLTRAASGVKFTTCVLQRCGGVELEDMVEPREDEVPDAEDCDDRLMRVGMDKGAGFGYANSYRAGGKLGRT